MPVNQPPSRQRTAQQPRVSGTDPQKSVNPAAPRVSTHVHEQSMSAPRPLTAKQEAGRFVNQLSEKQRLKNAVAPGSKQAAGVKSSAPNVSGPKPLNVTPSEPIYGEGDVPIELDQYTEKQAYKEGDNQSEGESQEVGEWHYEDVVQYGEDISGILTDSQISELSEVALREYELDNDSRKTAVEDYDKAMEAARAETKRKDYPFQNAANIKYPLLNTATFQFAARAYPAIVKPGDIVKVKVNGKDPDGSKKRRASRIGAHMSYQLLEKQPEWEKQMDELLHHLPLAGTAFKCIYYDTKLKRNTTELVNMRDFVVNNDAKNLRDCPRYTRIREYYPNEIKMKMRTGFYRTGNIDFDDEQDSAKSQIVLEQHRMHDLDGDGVDESYVVTIHKDSQEVLRVVPAADMDTLMVDEDDEGRFVTEIQHEPMYVRYIFMPDPEGKIYGLGFGRLLAGLGGAINTTINQMLDAGHLQNAGGGFLGGNVDFGKKRELTMAPNKWHQLKASGIDIRQAIVPHQHAGPSPALFSLLEFLIDAGKEVSNVKDVLSGDSAGANMPVGTVHALVEQGLQQFTAIYKRIYRSLTEEFKLLYRLNHLYLADEDYVTYHDEDESQGQQPVTIDDYQEDNDVCPVSDPSSVTSMQRMAKLGFVMEMMANEKLAPEFDGNAVARANMEGAGIEDAEELMAKPLTPEQRQEQQMMKDIEISGLKAEVEKLISEAQRNMAVAEKTAEDIEQGEAKLALEGAKLGIERSDKLDDADFRQQEIDIKKKQAEKPATKPKAA